MYIYIYTYIVNLRGRHAPSVHGMLILKMEKLTKLLEQDRVRSIRKLRIRNLRISEPKLLGNSLRI